MKHYPRGLQGALQSKMQKLETKEADFEKLTWTFGAPSFSVSAGEYLVIPKREWDAFWDQVDAESN